MFDWAIGFFFVCVFILVDLFYVYDGKPNREIWFAAAMSNFLSIRNGPPNDSESIQTGTSPGWLKGNVFREMYPHMSESDVETEDEILRTSLGDPSYFIDGISFVILIIRSSHMTIVEYSQSSYNDSEETLIPLSLIHDLYSPFTPTRRASIEKVIDILKKQQLDGPVNFNMLMRRMTEYINNCSYMDVQNEFFCFANYSSHVWKFHVSYF